MLFLLWFCSPLPGRGLLVRVRFLVKGRVCRSPCCIKFLTLHPSLFAIVTLAPNFMMLLLALCFSQSQVLLKRGFGVFTGCICLILFWMILSAGMFRKCFPVRSGKQRSKLHCNFKGKGHRIHSKEKSCLQDLSKSQPIPACIVFISLHFDHFIWAFLLQVICIAYSMRRIYYFSFSPLKIKLTEML